MIGYSLACDRMTAVDDPLFGAFPTKTQKLSTFRTFIYCALTKPNCRLKFSLFIHERLNHISCFHERNLCKFQYQTHFI